MAFSDEKKKGTRLDIGPLKTDSEPNRCRLKLARRRDE